MVEEHVDDASKFGSSSMSLSLPLLVFHHHPNNGQQEDNKANNEDHHPNDGQQEDDEANDNDHHPKDDDHQEDDAAAADDDMLMFSISKQSLHANMKRQLVQVAGDSSMCWATPQGWMLHVTQQQQGHDDDDTDGNDTVVVYSACLWNPSTGDKLLLPDIREEEHRLPHTCRCLLSHKDPTSRRPGCVVVLFHPSTPDLWYCQTIIDDDDDETRWRWRHYSYDIGNYKLPVAYRPPTKKLISTVAAVQGRFYFINSVRDMCAIEFFASSSSDNDDDSPAAFHYFDAHKVAFPEGVCFGSAWLLGYDDQLCLVDVSYVGMDPHNIGAVRVFKMDFSPPPSTPSSKKNKNKSKRNPPPPPRWRRIRDIGDTVFLLDNTGLATCCPASLHGLKRNQIYFLKNIVKDDADVTPNFKDKIEYE